jgi:hypothetical protein
MITVRNRPKERLEAGELALGVGLRHARTAEIARIMKTPPAATSYPVRRGPFRRSRQTAPRCAES